MSDPAWRPDPFRRHQYRWWDGEQWTEKVADDGAQKDDPLGEMDVAASPPQQMGSYRTGQNIGGQLDPTQWDGEPPTLPSKGKRIGAELLNILLIEIPLIWPIWYIWAFIVFGQGQTPAKQMFKMRVVSLSNNHCLDWGMMALREMVLKGRMLHFLASVTASIGIFIDSDGLLIFSAILWILLAIWWIANFILIFTNEQQRASWDRILNTVVIDDPTDRFDPRKVQ